jgi:chemotaxis signal transduction protein
VTHSASASALTKGLVSLGGIIVTVVDMRTKSNFGHPTCDAFTAVIILNVKARAVGTVDDSVQDAAVLSTEHISVPAYGSAGSYRPRKTPEQFNVEVR